MVLRSAAFGRKGDPLTFCSLRATGIAQYGPPTKKKKSSHSYSVACVMTLVEEQWITRVQKKLSTICADMESLLAFCVVGFSKQKDTYDVIIYIHF